ncbi:MAG: DUF58 domain-containing protein [Gammaproteobacteria bacterium]|nr:DUF58 domain-containing protein [Gammaproteobacteria bacterium]
MNELADRPVRVPEEIILIHWWRVLRWFANLRLVPRRFELRARLLTRFLRLFYYDTFTRAGKVVLLCSFFIFIFSYRVTSDYLSFTAAFGIGLLAWSLILVFVFRPKISLRRDTPATAVAGEALTSQISIRNSGRFTLYNFSVRELFVPYGHWPREWFFPHQIALAPDQQITQAISFEPQRRGLLKLSGVAVQTYFPFFLTRFTRRIAEKSNVYVLPPTLKVSIPSLRHIADQATKKLALGADNSRKGPSLEYAYSRQCQMGDSLRRLDHRAGSRLGKPMSKVFEGAEEIRRDRVHIIVDLTLKDFLPWQRRPVDDTPLDERLALAVEIGLSAQNEGFTLTALATGNKWHGVESLLDFYKQIAICEPQRACLSEGKVFPQQALEDNGLQILVIGRWTEEARSLVERWQSKGILVLVFLVPESKEDIDSLPIGSNFIEIQNHADEGDTN